MARPLFSLCHWVGRKKGSGLVRIPLLVLIDVPLDVIIQSDVVGSPDVIRITFSPPLQLEQVQVFENLTRPFSHPTQ